MTYIYIYIYLYPPCISCRVKLKDYYMLLKLLYMVCSTVQVIYRSCCIIKKKKKRALFWLTSNVYQEHWRKEWMYMQICRYGFTLIKLWVGYQEQLPVKMGAIIPLGRPGSSSTDAFWNSSSFILYLVLFFAFVPTFNGILHLCFCCNIVQIQTLLSSRSR